MAQENEISVSEMGKTIELELSKLRDSSFKNDEYHCKLLNLIDGIKQMTSGIIERTEFITENIKDKRDPNHHIEALNGLVNIINTLCDVLSENISPDDFMIISNLIYTSNRLYQLGQCV